MCWLIQRTRFWNELRPPARARLVFVYFNPVSSLLNNGLHVAWGRLSIFWKLTSRARLRIHREGEALFVLVFDYLSAFISFSRNWLYGIPAVPKRVKVSLRACWRASRFHWGNAGNVAGVDRHVWSRGVTYSQTQYWCGIPRLNISSMGIRLNRAWNCHGNHLLWIYMESLFPDLILLFSCVIQKFNVTCLSFTFSPYPAPLRLP